MYDPDTGIKRPSLNRRDFLGIGAGVFAFAAGLPRPGAIPGHRTHGRSATVEMDVVHASVLIPLTLRGPQGVERTVKCWLDTGGGAVIVDRNVAAALGLRRRDTPEQQGLQEVDPARATVADLQLDLSGIATYTIDNAFFTRAGAEAFLPSRILARYHVVFDYPGRTFTIADPGTLQPRGTAVPTPVSEQMRFPRIPISVDGEEYGMLLDTGASHTMLSNALIDQWSARHPDWRSIDAALGTANMASREADQGQRMFCIASPRIGGIDLGHMSVVSRREGTFEKYMSGMMSAPIVGAIAGNVLRRFRVEIDYQAGITYLSDPAPDDERDLTLVPLTLEAGTAGEFLILDAADPPLTTHIGDRLLSIDGTAVTGLPFARAVDLLRGHDGARKTLRLEKDGVSDSIEATVIRFC